MGSDDLERAAADRDEPPQASAAEPRERLLEAMAERHPFPGYYPVVVIGLAELAFREALVALLEDHDSVVNFRMSERLSRQGNYVSYHLEVYVAHAEAALDFKDSLSALEGVRALL